MEYRSAVKRHELPARATARVTLRSIVSDRTGDTLSDAIHVFWKKQSYRDREPIDGCLGRGRGLAVMDTGNLEEDENTLDLDCGAGYRPACLGPNSKTYTPGKGMLLNWLYLAEADFTERPGLGGSPFCSCVLGGGVSRSPRFSLLSPPLICPPI